MAALCFLSQGSAAEKPLLQHLDHRGRHGAGCILDRARAGPRARCGELGETIPSCRCSCLIPVGHGRPSSSWLSCVVGFGRCGEPWCWLQEVAVVGLVPGASGTGAVLGDVEVWEAAGGNAGQGCHRGHATGRLLMTFLIISEVNRLNNVFCYFMSLSLNLCCSDGLYYSCRNLLVPLFSLPVFYGLPSFQKHQWKAVKPAGNEQGSLSSL